MDNGDNYTGNFMFWHFKYYEDSQFKEDGLGGKCTCSWY